MKHLWYEIPEKCQWLVVGDCSHITCQQFELIAKGFAQHILPVPRMNIYSSAEGNEGPGQILALHNEIVVHSDKVLVTNVSS